MVVARILGAWVELRAGGRGEQRYLYVGGEKSLIAHAEQSSRHGGGAESCNLSEQQSSQSRETMEGFRIGLLFRCLVDSLDMRMFGSSQVQRIASLASPQRALIVHCLLIVARCNCLLLTAHYPLLTASRASHARRSGRKSPSLEQPLTMLDAFRTACRPRAVHLSSKGSRFGGSLYHNNPLCFFRTLS